MKKEDLIVKPDNFQLEPKKATDIQKSFLPKLQEQDAYSRQYREIVEKEITPELVEEASKLRKSLVKVRTSTDKIRKSEKNYYLQAGKFVDVLGKKITVPIQEMENKLSEIEDYYDRLEREKKEKIADERYEALSPYVEDPYAYNVGEMEQDVFDSFLFAKKEQHKTAQQQEQKRLEEERKQEELQKTYSKRKDLVLSLAEHFEWDKLNKDTTEETFNKLKQTAEKKKKEKDAEIEKLKQKQRLKEIRREKLKPYYSIPNIEISESVLDLTDKDFNKKLEEFEKIKQQYLEQKRKKEQEEKEREKEILELKRQKQQQELIQKQKLEAKDSSKIQYLIDDIENLKSKYAFSSEKYKNISNDVDSLLTKIVKHIKTKK